MCGKALFLATKPDFCVEVRLFLCATDCARNGGRMLTETEQKTVNEILFELKRIETMICDLMDTSGAQNETEAFLEKSIVRFSLSEREGMVLRLIADGRSNNDISEQIHVSLSTVKKHVYNIFNKVGVNSRTQLLNLVLEMGR